MDIRKTLLPVMLIPLTAMASVPSDTTLMVNNRQITVNDSAGITSVTVYDKSGGQLTRTYETCFADGQEVERVYVTSPFIPQMLGKNKRPMNAFGFSGSSALHTRDSKSWEFGFTLASVAFRLGGNFALTTAMQTTWAYNHFQGNNVMTTTDGMSSLEKKEDVKVKKSYITYSTIRIPLMMEWSEKSFYAGLGASVDMRMSGKLRPSYSMRPLSTRCRPMMDFSNTVLPEPLGPIIMLTLPASNTAEMSFSTGSPPSNDFTTCFTSIIASCF